MTLQQFVRLQLHLLVGVFFSVFFFPFLFNCIILVKSVFFRVSFTYHLENRVAVSSL